ncbi:hypothetical protein KIN20_025694 [Parelaphostrongylus tenuis]|uniref:Uncharacterized protein n=1 Tax=Parelaphostrongylus tenuis TaxID=148309 RepID=A0AAD5NC18_PARTN|nr:hypothetical protein KIN20_025694 [Parelaphostrongylus tenuis]
MASGQRKDGRSGKQKNCIGLPTEKHYVRLSDPLEREMKVQLLVEFPTLNAVEVKSIVKVSAILQLKRKHDVEKHQMVWPEAEQD